MHHVLPSVQLEEIIAPAFQGTIYNSTRLWLDDTGPVLSLLWLRLRAGSDLYDKTKTPSRFWEAVLGYIANLPDCDGLLWGHCIGSTEPEVLLLIRWRSVARWAVFQSSSGVGLLQAADLISGDPISRTMILDEALWDALATPQTLLDLRLLLVDRSASNLTSSDGLGSQISRRHELAARMGSIASHVQVAERYVSWSPTKEKWIKFADTLPDAIVDLSVWKGRTVPQTPPPKSQRWQTWRERFGPGRFHIANALPGCGLDLDRRPRSLHPPSCNHSAFWQNQAL